MLAPPDRFQTLAWVIGLLVVGVAVKCFFEFGQESLVGSVVNLSLFDLRNRFYRNVIHLDVDQFGDQGTSELMARFTNDMESLGAGVKMLFGKVVAEPLRALACVVVRLLHQLAADADVPDPGADRRLHPDAVGRIMKRATRRLLERMSSIYKILQESFQGIRVVKAFTMEPSSGAASRRPRRTTTSKAMLVVNIDALADPIIEVLGVAAVAGALLAGSYLVLTSETHLFGMRLDPSSRSKPRRLLTSVRPAGRHRRSGAQAVQRVHAHPVRLRRGRPHLRLHRPPAARARQQRRPAAAASGRTARLCRGRNRPPTHIEFRDVCFSYDPEQPILHEHPSRRPRRRDAGPGRAERLRQIDAAEPAAALLRSGPRHASSSTATTCAPSTCAACASRSAWSRRR